LPHAPCEIAEAFGVFGHVAHVHLKEGKPLFERGELFKELFLGKLLFWRTVFVSVLPVDKTSHDDAPLWIGSCIPGVQAAIRRASTPDLKEA
jgi:hypothetical protein